MSNQVEKFDPSTLMQGVKDRIKATFVSLIPDDKWEEMVQQEITRYFQSIPNSRYRDNMSEFSWTVYEAINEHVKQLIKETLANPEFQVNWNNGNATVSEVIQEQIVKRAPEIFMQSIQSMIGSAIQNMRYNG
jgi:uncharacterized membrane-anchored protein YjiN (DUF445 family)